MAGANRKPEGHQECELERTGANMRAQVNKPEFQKSKYKKTKKPFSESGGGGSGLAFLTRD